MEIVIKTILWQIITQCAETQDIIKKLASCDPCGRKSGLKTVAFLLRLSILPHNIPPKMTKLFSKLNLTKLFYISPQQDLYSPQK